MFPPVRYSSDATAAGFTQPDPVGTMTKHRRAGEATGTFELRDGELDSCGDGSHAARADVDPQWVERWTANHCCDLARVRAVREELEALPAQDPTVRCGRGGYQERAHR